MLARGGVMRRFYVEVACHILNVDDVDTASEMLMDALLEEPRLIEPDLTAQLSTGLVTVTSAADAEDEGSALQQVLIGIRSAAHKLGAGTATWDADTQNVTASVRPYDLAVVDC